MRDHPNDRSTALAVPQRTALAAEFGMPHMAADAGEPGLHFRDLLRIFLKRKWTIAAIFVLSAVISVVLTYLAAPLYRASMTIQIERLTPQVLNYKEITPVESEYFDTGDFYYTNYELLKSRKVKSFGMDASAVTSHVVVHRRREAMPVRAGMCSLLVRVEATIGPLTSSGQIVVWRTSVFPLNAGGYLLPVKAEVRKKAGIGAGDEVTVELELL